MLDLLTTDNLIALVTLTSLEVVLGIDNVVFLSILTGRLPEEQRAKGRFIGLALAMAMRVGLLFAISWVMGLTETLFEIADHGVSGRDLILLLGGLFLVGKATYEIHHQLEGPDEELTTGKAVASFGAVMVQVMLLDVVFSLDSVITAVGMADEIWVMVVAVIFAIIAMATFLSVVLTYSQAPQRIITYFTATAKAWR